MIEHTLDPLHSILYLRPKDALEQSDFVQVAMERPGERHPAS